MFMLDNKSPPLQTIGKKSKLKARKTVLPFPTDDIDERPGGGLRFLPKSLPVLVLMAVNQVNAKRSKCRFANLATTK